MDIRSIIKQDFISLSSESTVSEMIGKLRTYEKRTALIFNNGKYLGAVEKKRLLKTRLDTSTAKIKNLVHQTPIIAEDADIFEVAKLMYESNVDYIPVERNKKIVGTVCALDLLSLLANTPQISKLHTADVKIIRPSPVVKDDPIATALKVMYEDRIEQVPIFFDGKLYGVLSFRDVLRRYLNWTPKRQFSAKFNKMASSRGAEVDMPSIALLPVEDFSTNVNLQSCSEHETLPCAIEIMVKNNLYDLLILNEGAYVGMVTSKNILGTVASLMQTKDFEVQYVGMNQAKLSFAQKDEIKDIADKEARKIQRKLKQHFVLVIHLKQHSKGGTERKYSVHMKIEHPGRLITVSEGDWDPLAAVHKGFENALNQIKEKKARVRI